jgi:hypothetical protein
MRLCIADPPYLGRSRYYDGRGASGFRANGRMNKAADANPDAAQWDDPEAHRALARSLLADYDGFAIAMSRDSLALYLSELPLCRVAVWHNPAAWPPGNRIHATWEPALLHVPEGRRALGSGVAVKDVLSAVPPRHLGFIGSKPRAWTRWVLDMLGYDPETDTVDDLFHGSGAVAAEIAQGVLL